MWYKCEINDVRCPSSGIIPSHGGLTTINCPDKFNLTWTVTISDRCLFYRELPRFGLKYFNFTKRFSFIINETDSGSFPWLDCLCDGVMACNKTEWETGGVRGVRGRNIDRTWLSPAFDVSCSQTFYGRSHVAMQWYRCNGSLRSKGRHAAPEMNIIMAIIWSMMTGQ